MSEQKWPWAARWSVVEGDAAAMLRHLPENFAQTCITSPPYYGLRDYGREGQIGLEPTPAEYVAKLVAVFEEVRRVLKDDGTLWLNLGDSYVNAKGQSGGVDPKQGARRHGLRPQDSMLEGLKRKDMIGIPWRVAFALQSAGWYLRQDIIWAKPNPMPAPVTDRCVSAHEYLFLLSKSPRYYFDHKAIQEEATTGANGSRFDTGKTGASQTNCSTAPRVDSEKRNKRSVWTVTPKPLKEAHFAVMPPGLAEPCVLAGSALGDIVLDPFNGAGTTGLVALANGRRYWGIELNPAFIEITKQRLTGETGNLFEVSS